MLVIVLTASLFVTHAMRDKAGLKGFMPSLFDNAPTPSEQPLPTTTTDKQRIIIAVPTRVAVVLWDEQNNQNNGAAAGVYPREPGKELCPNSALEHSEVCLSGSIEELLLKSAQDVTRVIQGT